MMGKETINSKLAGIPAWGLSLMTLLISIVLVILLNDESKSEMLGNTLIKTIFFVALMAVACFLICRAHPRSVWYTPVICNALVIVFVIIAATNDPDIWTNLFFWLFFGGSLLFSIAGAIVGSMMGRRIIEQAK